MRSLTWVGVSGSNKGWRNTHRIASVSPISCPAPAADASSCFNSLILLAISGSTVSPNSRASCSTIGPQCEICSLISVSCRSSSLSLSLADSYIFVAVSSGITHLYNNVHNIVNIYFHIVSYRVAADLADPMGGVKLTPKSFATLSMSVFVQWHRMSDLLNPELYSVVLDIYHDLLTGFSSRGVTFEEMPKYSYRFLEGDD